MRGELAKLATVRAQVAGAVLSALAAPVLALLVGATGGVGSHDTLSSAAATASLAGVLGFGTWAALATTGEYIHGTITVSLVATGSRRALYLGKVAAAGLVASVGGVVAMLTSLVLVNAVQPPGHHTVGPVAALAVVPVAYAAAAVAGVAVGVLTRSPLGAVLVVGAGVLLPKAAAGLLGGLEPWVVGAAPGTVVTQWVRGAELPAAETFPLGEIGALVAMLLVAAVVAVAGGLTLCRRDGG